MFGVNMNDTSSGSFIKTEAGLDNTGTLLDEPTNEGQQLLDTFWQRCMEDCVNLNPNTEFKVQELPLARIKKIMKLDEDVKMISAEAPIIFAKACELFVAELTTRAWIHTEESKRRTLQKTDVAMAVSKYDMFDFLIDIVPRDEIKATQKTKGTNITGGDQVQYLVQLPASALNGSSGGQPITLNFGGQQILINTSEEGQNGTNNDVTQLVNNNQQLLQIPMSQVMYQNNSNGSSELEDSSAGVQNQMQHMGSSQDGGQGQMMMQTQGGSTNFYCQEGSDM